MPELLAAIEKQKQGWDWLKEGGKFIPHPEKWLNYDGWLNEVISPPQTQNRASPLAPGQVLDGLPPEAAAFGIHGQTALRNMMTAFKGMEEDDGNFSKDS
jgi:hypothetical protein